MPAPTNHSLMRESFREFFRSVHGVNPYPWQERLLEQVASTGWPEAIALPTGSGKTAAIDIALFHMAFSPNAPRRVVYVVNRRSVVDQTEARVLHIQRRLRQALHQEKGAVRFLAERLSAYAGEGDGKGEPLLVAKLRGGASLPRHPVDDPARPAILLSTVDQVGSRLLFRGYGLSPMAWPIEAGLLGFDTLFLLDEAHLERPFFTLLRELEKQLAPAARRIGRSALRAVAMSATPETLGKLKAFTVNDDDLNDPRLRRRWSTPKSLTLKVVEPKELVTTLADEARNFHDTEGGLVVVFCNQVDRARQVYKKLQPRFGKRVLLLTGRIRPFERDRLLTGDLQTKLDRREVTILVTTQALEVGGDLSFINLVSELCPLPSIIQRVGRWARRGEQGASGVIVRAEGGSPHPYKTDELDAAWAWLQQLGKGGQLNAGIEALDRARREIQPQTWGHATPSARYTPEILQLFALTDPHIPELEPGPFLHGLEERSQEVAICFRADLDPTWLDRKTDLADLSDLIPAPNAYEMLSVPLWAARAFLGGMLPKQMTAAATSDLESEPPPPTGRRSRKGPRRALRYLADGERTLLQVVDPSEIRPGDTLLVPADYGGLDRFGWNPEASDPVRDVAEARPPAGKPPRGIRLHPRVLRDMLKPSAWKTLTERVSGTLGERPGRNDQADALSFLASLLGRPHGLAAYFESLQDVDAARLARIEAELDRKFDLLGIPLPRQAQPDDGGLETLLEAAGRRGVDYVASLLRWLRIQVEPQWYPAVDRAQTSLARTRIQLHPAYPGLFLRLRSSSLSVGGDVPVSLETHQRAVLRVLEDFLRRLGLLHQPEAPQLKFAARRHDEGKRDPRMQTWMFLTAPEGESLPPPPLAKSGTHLGPRAIAQRRAVAGYPEGQRHELQAASALLRRANPPDLLAIYLIATHHGRARPFPEPPQGEGPELTFTLWDGTEARAEHGLDRLASGWALIFSGLQSRYTPWGLAYLEVLVRLADYRASANQEV